MFSLITGAQLCLAILFITWLIRSDHGPKEPRKLLVTAGVFGALAVIIALLLETHLLPAALSEHPDQFTRQTLLHYSLLVGLIEEGAKALPLAIFLLLIRSIDEVTDGIIYFGISGMIFGLLEDIGYTLSLGPAAGIGKIIIGPFIHAGFCVLIGWAIASVKVQKRPWLLAPIGFTIAVGLHGLYDFGLFYGSDWSILMALAITVFVNVNIIFLMRRARAADAQLGISAPPDTTDRHSGQG